MKTKFKAMVLGFDRSRGEGFIKIEGQPGLFDIYACNIPGKKTWYPGTACMYYHRDQEIEIEVVDGGIKCLSRGTFDKKKWDSLDHANLAFRCDENGNALNGLFG